MADDQFSAKAEDQISPYVDCFHKKAVLSYRLLKPVQTTPSLLDTSMAAYVTEAAIFHVLHK